MKTYKFYERLSPFDKNRILRKFRYWSKEGKDQEQIILNLNGEHFLPETLMIDIFKIINSSLGDNFSIVLDKLLIHAKNNLCEGGNSNIKVAMITVGSVIPRVRFFNYLKEHFLDRFIYEYKIKEFIDTLY